ncbi:uncharacterized protein LOC110841819 isoform X2 [Folsomia candida]|uniref:uncharacterized protein LOC110841819 isoform X2 n=1 Tax=Folsomia candida TaxID=158441 RepID=UPI001604F938|nr:uncharacterized protein LOC110841819 isoform X2 [Folsomia candida]
MMRIRLLSIQTTPDLSAGIFTNFSHEPTWRWYFAITPFEAFFLGIILTQFAVLNLLGIFPLNLTALVGGMPNGRKKRDTFHVSQRKRDIASQLLKLMKKLDQDECSFKAICQLESFTKFPSLNNVVNLPPSITSVLTGLKQVTKKRERGELLFTSETGDLADFESLQNLELPGIDKSDDDVIALYETAVRIGGSSELGVEGGMLNATSPCEKRYHRCPITGDDTLGYVSMMNNIDDLLEFY